MKHTIIIAALAAMLVGVATMDYEDAKRQAQKCADMVEAGIWLEEVCDG